MSYNNYNAYKYLYTVGSLTCLDCHSLRKGANDLKQVKYIG